MAEPQNPAPEAPKQNLKCTDCGHDQFATQLREVKVVVGWDRLQIAGIAPCHMCTRCGKAVVGTKATIGKLAGLVTEQDARRAAGVMAEGQTSDQLNAAIESLTEMRDRQLEVERAAAKPNRKARRGAGAAGKKKTIKRAAPKKKAAQRR